MQTLSDAELVQAMRSGIASAYEAFVRRFERMVLSIAFGVIGDFDLAEDAAQEAFLRCFEHLTQLNEPERLRSWVASVTRNCAIDVARRQRTPSESLDAMEESKGFNVAYPYYQATTLNPRQGAIAEEEDALVMKAMAALPLEYREVLVLRIIRDMTYEEIAALLELGLSNVKVRLHRGRKLLAEKLKDVGLRPRNKWKKT
ncbi:MAG: sigma-70 family RNA polymerase sigma factor [bacterium]